MLDLSYVMHIMVRVAKGAGSLLLNIQTTSKRLTSRKDFLTDADLQSEKVILEALAMEYPDIPSFSEEKGGAETREGYLWVVDPIDGTLNYFNGDESWSVSIALVRDGRTVAGVVYMPSYGRIFTALEETNSKSFSTTGEAIGVSVNDHSDLNSSQFLYDWGKEEHGGADHEKVYSLIKRLDQHSLYPRTFNCSTAGLMKVVTGKVAGYVFPKPEPFDIAAAAFIVEKAGGKVTDMEGNPWNPFSRGIIATNGLIHDELLHVLR